MEFPCPRYATPRSLGPLLVACMLCCGFTAGCQSLREQTGSLANSTRDVLTFQKFRKPKEADLPSRMVAIWSESTIVGPNQVPIRGLGGRIYLYNRNHQAVKGDGDLIVYAYNDEGSNEEKVEPDRKYVISADELKRHYSPSEFGPSYSVWIPWDSAANDSLALSVVPIFKNTDGPTLVGDHSRNLLSGKGERAGVLAQRLHQSEKATAVQPASFQDSKQQPSGDQREASDATDDGGIKTSTIRVPASMRQRLLQSTDREDRDQDGANDRKLSSPSSHLSGPLDDPRVVAELLRRMESTSGGSVKNHASDAPSDSTPSTDRTANADPPSLNRPVIHRGQFQPRVPAWRGGWRAGDRTESQRDLAAQPSLPPSELQ